MEWNAWVEHHTSGQDREQGAEDSKFWASIERTQQQQQLRGGLEANENSPMDIAEDGVSISVLDRLRDFTGGVPLNLRNFLQCKGGTLDEKVDAFTEAKTFGEQIVSDLDTFTTAFAASNKLHLKSQHIKLMQSALIESKTHMKLDLIDQRYFFHKDGAVHPVSGFVRKTMAIILQVYAQKEYFAGLTPDWVRSALESKHPIVCGFAYEEFCLALICKDPSQLHPTLRGVDLTIKRFDGNAPPSSQLNADGCVLFWPNKFNLRHVDAVLRWVTTDSYRKTSNVSNGISSTKKTKKRKTATSTEIKHVETDVTVFAIQVTLQTPVAHKQSLEFVKQDALAYMRKDETALHRMVWVVPKKSTKPKYDRDDVLQHLSVITTD
jgi:hypothetical protein